MPYYNVKSYEFSILKSNKSLVIWPFFGMRATTQCLWRIQVTNIDWNFVCSYTLAYTIQTYITTCNIGTGVDKGAIFLPSHWYIVACDLIYDYIGRYSLYALITCGILKKNKTCTLTMLLSYELLEVYTENCILLLRMTV